jgi:hypothetical protein
MSSSDGPISISTYQAMTSGAALLPPGGFGPFDKPALAFHNTAPRTRVTRRHTMNRDEVERARLRERRGKFGAYAEPGGLTVPDASAESAAYMADADRFHGEAAAEEREARDAAAARATADIARRRAFAQSLEAKRAEEQVAADRKWDEDTARLQASGSAAFKNRGGLPIDLVHGGYASGAAGEALRDRDRAGLTRVAQRAQFLAEHATSSHGYDPLTGAPAPVTRATAALAESLGVPAPAQVGVHHATYVNASVTGAHLNVRETTRSRLSLRTLR